MGKTRIEWADEVWNPVTGCTPVSEGCRNCYARRMAKRLAGRYGYPVAPNEFEVTVHPEKMNEPFKWKKPQKIFVCSMGDVFHPWVTQFLVTQIFAVAALARKHTFMVLTKRPQRMLNILKYDKFFMNVLGWVDEICADNVIDAGDIPWPLPNVWLGVSVEDQKVAHERIPLLLETPAAVRFVSCEPLLGPVDLRPWLDVRCADCYSGAEDIPPHDHELQSRKLDWVIVGGETGPGARWMRPDWVRGIRDKCLAAGVPFFYKGWGEYFWEFDGSKRIVRWRKVGKKISGRILDGKTWEERPGD
jgi:protein gp37